MKTPYSTIRISPGLEVRSKHLPSKLEEDRLERIHRQAWQDGKTHEDDYLTSDQNGWWAEISKTKPLDSIDNGMGSLYDLDRRPLSDRFPSHNRLTYPHSPTHQPASLTHRPLHSHDAATSHSRHFRTPQRSYMTGPVSQNHVNYTVVGLPQDTNSSTINLEIPIHSSLNTDRNYQLNGNTGEQFNENGWWKSNIGGKLTLPEVDNQKLQYLQDGRPHSDKYIHSQRDTRRRRSHQPAALDHRPAQAALDHRPLRYDIGHRQTHHITRSHALHFNRTTDKRDKHQTYGYVLGNQQAKMSQRAIPNELGALKPYQQHLKQDVLSQSRHFRTTQLKQRSSHQENNGPPQAIQISISGKLTLPEVDNQKLQYLQDGRPHSDKYIHSQRDTRRRRSHQPAALDHRPAQAALDHRPLRYDIGHRQTHHITRSHALHFNRTTDKRDKHQTYGYVLGNQQAKMSQRAIPNELGALKPYQQHLKQDVLSQSRHFRTTQLKQRSSHQENNGPPQAIQISISVNKRDSIQK